jgi:hypothetical protein
MQVGQVFWIPKKDELPIDIGLEEGMRGHPCVTLSDSPDCNGMIVILTVGLIGLDNDQLIDLIHR